MMQEFIAPVSATGQAGGDGVSLGTTSVVSPLCWGASQLDKWFSSWLQGRSWLL